MQLLALAPNYVRWHYSSALKSITVISQNIIWFIWHFFSIQELSRTLFAPWQRLQEKHDRGKDIGDYFEVFAINILMRIVGALVRIVMIVFGLAFIILAAASMIAFFVLWIFLPVVILFTLFLGFILLVKPV